MTIEFLPVDDNVKTAYEHIREGTAFKKDLVEHARAMTNQMADLAAVLKDMGMQDHANRVKAMSQVTMSSMHEYLNDKITNLTTELAVANSWTSDYLGFGLDVKDENNTLNPPPPAPYASPFDPGLVLAAYTASLEAVGRQNQADLVQSMLNRVMTVGYGDKLFDIVIARNQYAPMSAALYNTATGDTKWLIKFGQMALDKEKLYIAARAINPFDALDILFGTNKVSDCRAVYDDFINKGALSQEAATFVGGRTEYALSSVAVEFDDPIWRNEPGACRFGNNADLPASSYEQVVTKQGSNQ